MRPAAVIAVAAAVLGAAAWFAFRGAGGDAGPDPQPTERSADEGPSAPAILEGREAPSPGEPPMPAPAATPSAEEAAPGKAGLRVKLLGPDGERVPVPARVTVEDASGRVVTAETGAEGSTVFEQLAPGVAKVDVAAAGFTMGWDATATLTAGETADLGVHLERGTSVEGRVVAARDGRPVSGASVDVRGGGALGGTATTGGRPSYGVVRTDADGRFRTPGLPFDFIMTVSVRARGFQRFEKAMLLLPVEGERPPLEVRLEPGGTARGTVLDPDGNPATGARVVVASDGHPHLLVESDERVFADPDVESALRATTDAEGRYVVEGLRFDVVYRAVAFGAGHAPSPASELRTDQTRPDARADLTLQRLGTVVVLVRGPAGETVNQAIVQVGRAESSVDKEGRATFSDLWPGEQSITVQALGFVRAQEMVPVPTGRVVEHTVRLQRGSTLAGVVVDDLGRPVAGASVSVSRDDGEVGGAATDAAGRFSVSGVPTGKVSVQVTADLGESPALEHVPVPGPDVRLVILRSAKVVARFTLPGAAPPPKQITVTDYALEGSGGGGSRAWEDGRVSWDVPAGKRVLRVRVDGFSPWEREVETTPAETLDLGDIALDVGVNLAGRVSDAAGHPVAGTVVGVEGHDGVKSQSDAEGRFRLDHLPRKQTRISAEASGFVPTTVSVDLASGSAPLDVRLHRGGRLVVTLVDEAGAPASGVRVHVHAPTAPDPDARGLWEWEDSDVRGRVETRLAPGVYRVDVLRDETVVATAPATLEDEKETSVEIRVPSR